MGKIREPKKPIDPEEEKKEEGSDEVESTEASESEPEPNLVQSAEKDRAQGRDSSEDGLDSESGSESDGTGEKFKPESVRSKTDSDPAPPSDSKAVKRPAGDGKLAEAKDSKRPKTKPKPGGQTSEKKQNRLWSEEDEIVILRGLIDYAVKKKADPSADMNAFHEFIKKKIHVDATRVQVQDKVRKLKGKYVNNKSKEIDGKGATFVKPHEEEVYELSKKIWGEESKVGNGGSLLSPRKVANRKIESANEAKAENGENGNINRVVNNKVVDAEAAKEVVKAENDKRVKVLKAEVGKRANVPWTVEERIMSVGAEAFEGGADVEGADEWRSLMVREFEGFLTQMEVKTAQVKLVLDYLKGR